MREQKDKYLFSAEEYTLAVEGATEFLTNSLTSPSNLPTSNSWRRSILPPGHVEPCWELKTSEGKDKT